MTMRALAITTAVVALTACAHAAPPTATTPASVRAAAALDTVAGLGCLRDEVAARVGIERIHVAVVLFPDGGWAPAVAIGSGAPKQGVALYALENLRQCVARQLEGLLGPRVPAPPPRATLIERELRLAPPRDDAAQRLGGPGALCSTGHGAGLDDATPVSCRPGLLCCSGGAAGSPGHCTAARICPPLP